MVEVSVKRNHPHNRQALEVTSGQCVWEVKRDGKNDAAAEWVYATRLERNSGTEQVP